MTAKERALTKRLADLEERVRHLEAEPREIHHHYPAPQPIYGFSQIVDNSPSGVLTTTCPDGDQFSYTTNGVQS